METFCNIHKPNEMSPDGFLHLEGKSGSRALSGSSTHSKPSTHFPQSKLVSGLKQLPHASPSFCVASLLVQYKLLLINAWFFLFMWHFLYSVNIEFKDLYYYRSFCRFLVHPRLNLDPDIAIHHHTKGLLFLHIFHLPLHL